MTFKFLLRSYFILQSLYAAANLDIRVLKNLMYKSSNVAEITKSDQRTSTTTFQEENDIKDTITVQFICNSSLIEPKLRFLAANPIVSCMSSSFASRVIPVKKIEQNVCKAQLDRNKLRPNEIPGQNYSSKSWVMAFEVLFCYLKSLWFQCFCLVPDSRYSGSQEIIAYTISNYRLF